MRIPSLLPITATVVCLISSCSLISSHRSNSAELRARIKQVIQPRLSRMHIPGYALTVIQDDQILFQHCYGYANLDQKAVVTPQTIFALSSITKTFTAAALLTLVDNRQVKLTDHIDLYLDGLPPAWRKITIKQLATRTSGIPNSAGSDQAWSEKLKSIEQLPLEFTPGLNISSGDPSYYLMGAIIEKVTKMPYLEYVEKSILRPLKMNHTGTANLATKAQLATPYEIGAGQKSTQETAYIAPESSYAAGMLSSNSEDLAAYAKALLSGKLLSAKAYRTLWYDRPNLPDRKAAPWAYGWGSRISAYYGRQRAIRATGGGPGCAATILIIPDSHLIVIGLANIHEKEIYQIPRLVAKVVLGIEEEIEEEHEVEEE